MHLHRSNRTEILVDRLARLVSDPVGDPFDREPIVVQGVGMERWLAMELSRRLGVWADPWFPFPRRLLERAFAAALPPIEEGAVGAFEPTRLTFVVAAVLAENLTAPGFETLRRYVERGDRDDRILELSVRIAEAFDRYAVYRQDLILRWDAGADDGWEARLWRELTARIGNEHLPARARRFLEAMRNERASLESFPKRISLFGISTLPPLFVEAFSALARRVEVHLFMLSPSSEFWADVRSRREQLAAARRHRLEPADLEALHFEIGNPLLAANGRLARDFQAVVESRVDYRDDGQDLYVEPAGGGTLATLQADILRLRHRQAESREAAPLPLDPRDRSIEIHACHSPMREVEVLRDRLLALFDDPELGLEPRDVIVMTPSIDDYAPCVQAAFVVGDSDEPRIPFRVTDRSVRATDGTIVAFLRVLETAGGRFGAPAIVDLLELEPVRTRFKIDAIEIDTIRRWVSQSGIRWGVDGEQRAEFELPPVEQNTWRFGLERLFLGYAMTGELEGRLFEGRLPVDGVEGTEADLLGRLGELVDVLARFRSDAGTPRIMPQWAERLSELVGAVIGESATGADELGRLRKAIDDLAVAASAAGFDGRVSLRAVRERLEATLDLDLPTTGFLAGGVTVCAMLPMRSIPFRVVCVLGLSDGAFPRSPRLAAFDRMARERRLGDRSPRDDDRFLFLEAILAARERLIVTYVGQSVHDNSELPPSVVVSELLDALDESFSVEKGAVRDHVLVRHPLQAFSSRYFDTRSRQEGARLVSYATLPCAGARAIAAAGEKEPAPFVVGRLGEARGEIDAVSLDELVSFFKNPARELVRKRLGFALGLEATRLLARESFELDNLQRWLIGDEILRRTLSAGEAALAQQVIGAKGVLPPFVLGELMFEKVGKAALSIAEVAATHLASDALDTEVVEQEIAGVRVSGELRGLRQSGQLIATYSKTGAGRELEAWIRHLFLCVATPVGCDLSTLLVTRGEWSDTKPERTGFRAASDARAILADLVELYLSGMERPLPFLPEVSKEFRQLRSKGVDAPAALARAVRFRWEDPYVDVVFGDLRESLAAELDAFADTADRVFAPLEGHLEDVE